MNIEMDVTGACVTKHQWDDFPNCWCGPVVFAVVRGVLRGWHRNCQPKPRPQRRGNWGIIPE